uniref:RNA helicase n=1 Tax=Arion vulgaris TaxID=1028688 RepID=A0A0B7BNA1_9EUPU
MLDSVNYREEHEETCQNRMADSEGITEQGSSSTVDGLRMHNSNGNVIAHHNIEHSSKVERMQAEIKTTIEEITRKTERTLARHQEKMKTYEQALKVMNSSTYSDDDDDDDSIEVVALIDKLMEVAKQQSTFCLRRDTLIEKVKKWDPFATEQKEITDLLKSVGVECERLGAALPIYAKREDIVEVVSKNQVSVILGETGSGKSTQMVQYIYESGLADQGLIVCTQPRKVAAITLAERVAKEMAGTVGALIGYKSGMKKKMSEMTKIVFETDHCLLNECLTDSNLSHYTCIIVDEAHERSIYTDLLLGMIKACLKNRPDLRVIITSATIDPEIFIKYFKSGPELRVSGRTFPVDVVYSDMELSKEFENFEMKAVQKAVDVHKNEETGDILVFLTSSVEIMRCCEEFEKLMAGRKDFKCFPLHGQLPPNEQKIVFEKLPPGIRKIVFATNCAETSITIDGIKYVIDTGVAKEMKFDSKRNICMLGTHVVSKSSADQRKGRAGRTGSGKCYRLYSEESYKNMSTSTEPEILRVPLGQSLLKLAELGVDVKLYDFVQPPSEEAIDSALSTLKSLGALSSEGITDIGRWISKLPFHPKEGFLVYHGSTKNLLYDSVVLASLITNGSNLFYRGLTESEAQSSAKSKSQFGSTYGDIFTWLEVYKAWSQIPMNKQFKWCQDHGINCKVMNFTKQCVKEVTTVLRNELKINVEREFASDEAATLSLRKMIFDANMASVCCYLGHVRAGYHALVVDRQVHLHPSSSLSSHNFQPEWIVYTEFTKTSRDFIKGITVIEEEWVLEAVSQGKLHVDINLAKQQRIKLVHKETIGSSIFRKLVGVRYSQLRVWEENLTNTGMRAVVVEAESDLGVLNVFSASTMSQDIVDCFNTVKREVVEILESSEDEIDILKKTGTEPSGVRVVLGQGGCVKSLLMPDQSNKILIKKTSSQTTEEEIREKLRQYGEIKECVRFKRSDPWGFVRYTSFAEAQAAVQGTKSDENNVAVLKIDTKFKKVVSKFEAKLFWCRRPIKGKGTAFVKCPPIERAGLIGRNIFLSGRLCELKVSNRGEDLVCFNTGTAQEVEIKKSVINILDYDEGLNQNINVTVVREPAVKQSEEDLNNIKRYLSEEFSRHIKRDKFSLRLMPVKPNSLNQVAFIQFESPIDGFRASQSLQGRLQVNDQLVEISLTLKTTLSVPKSIMNVCEHRFTEIITDLKKYKDVEIGIRKLKDGNFAFDIKSDKTQSMIESRELLQKELEGEIIDCKTNDLMKRLLLQQGKEALRNIESESSVLIVINDRKEQVHIYGIEKHITQAKSEINKYLDKLAKGKQVDVFLKGQEKPRGLMKELLKKYANLRDDLIEELLLVM